MGRHDATQFRALSASTETMFRRDGRVAFNSAAPGHLGSAMARVLADAGAHVIVNGRDDGQVPGPFPRDEVRESDPEFAARLASRTMLRRLGRAAEIAGPLLFLAAPASAYRTGTALTVDGGWTAW